MRKIRLLLLLALVPAALCGQNAKKLGIKDVRYYGIDFTQVAIIGATESPNDFIDAFNKINSVVVSESSKYNLPKAFKTNFVMSDISMVYQLNSLIEPGELITLPAMVRTYDIPFERLEGIVAGYDLQDNSGIGLVFIAQELNKSYAEGVYQVVFFSEDTREIIYSNRAYGKAGGFGLRNYWANSVYNMLKYWRW